MLENNAHCCDTPLSHSVIRCKRTIIPSAIHNMTFFGIWLFFLLFSRRLPLFSQNKNSRRVETGAKNEPPGWNERASSAFLDHSMLVNIHSRHWNPSLHSEPQQSVVHCGLISICMSLPTKGKGVSLYTRPYKVSYVNLFYRRTNTAALFLSVRRPHGGADCIPRGN